MDVIAVAPLQHAVDAATVAVQGPDVAVAMAAVAAVGVVAAVVAKAHAVVVAVARAVVAAAPIFRTPCLFT